MATTNSPNMSLPVPTVGVELGPSWANDINASLSILDQHNHTSGQGVQVPSSGMNINSGLNFQNNFATNMAGSTYTGQGSQPANNTVYNSNNATGDLYYVNAAGLNIQLTNASGIVGSSGSISGISGTASASYSSPTFFWRSATSIAANMDFAAAIMRNISPNSTNALTLQPPAALASNYTLTLPSIPGSTSFMTMDSSGNMGASVALLGALTTANLSASAAITGGQIALATITGGNIAANTIAAASIVNASITATQLSNDINLPGNNATVNSKKIITSNTNAASGLGIIRGGVDNSGNLNTGEGFTPGRVSLGIYLVTFTSAFADTPDTVASTSSSSATIASTVGASTTSVNVYIHDATGALADDSFNFITIGRRA